MKSMPKIKALAYYATGFDITSSMIVHPSVIKLTPSVMNLRQHKCHCLFDMIAPTVFIPIKPAIMKIIVLKTNWSIFESSELVNSWLL